MSPLLLCTHLGTLYFYSQAKGSPTQREALPREKATPQFILTYHYLLLSSPRVVPANKKEEGWDRRLGSLSLLLLQDKEFFHFHSISCSNVFLFALCST